MSVSVSVSVSASVHVGRNTDTIPGWSSDEEEAPGAKQDYGWLYQEDESSGQQQQQRQQPAEATKKKPRRRSTKTSAQVLQDRAKFAGQAAAICLASVVYPQAGLHPAVAFTKHIAQSLSQSDVSLPVVPTVWLVVRKGKFCAALCAQRSGRGPFHLTRMLGVAVAHAEGERWTHVGDDVHAHRHRWGGAQCSHQHAGRVQHELHRHPEQVVCSGCVGHGHFCCGFDVALLVLCLFAPPRLFTVRTLRALA